MYHLFEGDAIFCHAEFFLWVPVQELGFSQITFYIDARNILWRKFILCVF